MSNTEWELSGSVGTPAEIEGFSPQFMTQGLGFPLRPVAGVPPQDAGDLLNSENVASGSFMQFMSEGWQQGKWHLTGATVTNGEWTMVANKPTLTSPYPIPADNAELGTDPWTPATQSENAVVYSGHKYTFNEPCLLKKINMWVTQLTADTNYRVVGIYTFPDAPDDPITTVIEEPVLSVGVWDTIAFSNTLVPAGTELLLYIDALNSGASNEVTGGWTYTGQNNTGAPPAQSWNHNNANNVLRIDKTDLDGTDRTSELLGISINSTIVFADTSNPAAFDQYRVTSEPPVDQGTYIEYAVVLQEVGEGGVPTGTTTMTATIPIPQPTEYAEELATVPVYTGPNVVVEGFLQFDGVDQSGGANKYGIDLELESVTASPDWDVLAYNAP